MAEWPPKYPHFPAFLAIFPKTRSINIYISWYLFTAVNIWASVPVPDSHISHFTVNVTWGRHTRWPPRASSCLGTALQKYYINKLMFLWKHSIMWAGQTKFPGPVWQTSPTLLVARHLFIIRHLLISQKVVMNPIFGIKHLAGALVHTTFLACNVWLLDF